MKRMKRMYLFVVVIAAVYGVVVGCSLPFQLAADLAGNLVANKLKPSSNFVNSNLVLGIQLESYRVGKYEVRMSDGSFKSNPCFIFAAYYSDGKIYSAIGYEKDNPDDMKMMKDFSQMKETEKKSFIRAQFREVDKFNLGPETETAKKSPTPSQSIPIPSFAPSPR